MPVAPPFISATIKLQMNSPRWGLYAYESVSSADPIVNAAVSKGSYDSRLSWLYAPRYTSAEAVGPAPAYVVLLRVAQHTHSDVTAHSINNRYSTNDNSGYAVTWRQGALKYLLDSKLRRRRVIRLSIFFFLVMN